MAYDNNMQVIVGKVVSENTKAPTLRVNLEINGQKYKAGLWPWRRGDGTSVTDKNGNQQYKGVLEVDDFVPNQQQPAAPQPGANADAGFSDDIPFAPYRDY